MKKILLILIFILDYDLLRTGGVKRSKKTRQLKYFLPLYESFLSDVLPNDKQVSVFLKKGKLKALSYTSEYEEIPLTFIVSTCTSVINWKIISKSSPSSNVGGLSTNILANISTIDSDSFELKSSRTLYIVELLAINHDSFVHIYVSTEPGGPQAIKTSQNLQIKINKKQRRKQLSIIWEPSLVDPQSTTYCLVVNTKKNYRTLCSAQGEKYGSSFLSSTQQPMPASQTLISWMDSEFSSVPELIFEKFSINCVGHHTHFTVKDLKQGVGYYFDLFAINQQSNLTYHRGSSYMIFDNRLKPTGLRDGKISFVNLKKHDGKVTFRFKMKKSLTESLKVYIVPCGGTVDVQVSSKGHNVFSRRRIEGFYKLLIEKPKVGLRYYIKVMSSNRDELRKNTGVEILATTKPISAIPLPELPSDLTVEEFLSLRQCNSVTIGWIPSPNHETILYCVNVKQIRLKELESYEVPNQCRSIDQHFKTSKEHAVRHCREIKNFQEHVLTQTIKKLKPGRNYEIQVTAKRHKGKELSYNILYVKTKPFCEKSNKTRLKLNNKKEKILN